MPTTTRMEILKDVGKDMLFQCSDCERVKAWRISSDLGNRLCVGPYGSFYDHMSLAREELDNIIDVKDAIYRFEVVVESFERGTIEGFQIKTPPKSTLWGGSKMGFSPPCFFFRAAYSKQPSHVQSTILNETVSSRWTAQTVINVRDSAAITFRMDFQRASSEI